MYHLLLPGISATLRAQHEKSANHEERPAKPLSAATPTADMLPGTSFINSGFLKAVQGELRSQATETRVSFPGAGVVFVQRFAQSLQWARVKDLQVSAGPEVM